MCRRLVCVCAAERRKVKISTKELKEQTIKQAAAMAAQENTEVTTKFSTLNVNAVEFVPSFNYSSVASAAAVVAAAAQEAVDPPPTPALQQQQPQPVDNTSLHGRGTSSVPVSESATPATTPDSTGSVGSINALNAAVGGGGCSGTGAPSSGAASNSSSPAQGSPVTTPSTAAAAPIENINAADKMTANNGKYNARYTHTYTCMHIYLCFCVGW